MTAPWEIRQGDCRDLMAAMDSASVDAVVTDPPYGLSFMGVGWDHSVPGVEFWTAALRVAKPGAFLLAFGGTRTFHRLACAIEDAGWDPEDCLAWLYGQGFPKGKKKLKPAWEPILMARRPGGPTTLNVDACRLEVSDSDYARNCSVDRGHAGTRSIDKRGSTDIRNGGGSANSLGRWPANVLLDKEAAEQLDAQSGTLTSGANPTRRGSDKFRGIYHGFAGERECLAARGQDSGGASRFFYTAKATTKEREGAAGEHGRHPTVKPLALMRWLCRLVTPPGGLILDPFCGSGTTVHAALAEGFRAVGIELDPESASFARKRVAGPLFCEEASK